MKRNPHRWSPSDLGPESPTDLRYSLAHPRIRSHDFFVTLPHQTVRVIEYPEPSDPTRNNWRALLQAQGLLLGGDSQDRRREGYVSRIVPSSARPLAYDASEQGDSEFSYGDRKLFYDLGRMLASVAQLEEGRLVIADAEAGIGRDIAFVEFVRPHDRNLYLVPGVECLLNIMPSDGDPLDYYADQLSATFSALSHESVLGFQLGYAEVSIQGETS